MDTYVLFETGFALLRDTEMSRTPEERSVPYGPSGSKGKAHFQYCPDNHALLNK